MTFYILLYVLVGVIIYNVLQYILENVMKMDVREQRYKSALCAVTWPIYIIFCIVVYFAIVRNKSNG